jgi:hypothetical protein
VPPDIPSVKVVESPAHRGLNPIIGGGLNVEITVMVEVI